MMQWVLMGLISVLAGLVAGGALWMSMGLAPQAAAAYRAWQEKRALARAAAAQGGEAAAEDEK